MEQTKKELYEFEIQNCIKVRIKANNKQNARQNVIENISRYADDMVGGFCYVSNGTKIKRDE